VTIISTVEFFLSQTVFYMYNSDDFLNRIQF